MESENVIVWKDDRATQVEVAQLVNRSAGEILVDVTDAQQVKEWTKLLEPRAADDHAEGAVSSRAERRDLRRRGGHDRQHVRAADRFRDLAALQRGCGAFRKPHAFPPAPAAAPVTAGPAAARRGPAAA